MSETPIPGSPGDPPEADDLDGVVLYDPTAPDPPSDAYSVGAPPRRGRAALFVVVALVLAAGGYQAYRSWNATVLDATNTATLPPPIPDGGPGGSRTLVAIRGRGLAGPVGSSVLLVVRATGQEGIPLADSVVDFRVVEGEGLLPEDDIRTDADGIARTELLLPTHVGTVTVLARLAGSDLQTQLVVDVRAGPPHHVAATAGDRQEAYVLELLPVRPEVIVADEAGNPIPGAEVRFEIRSGGGMSGPSRALTDSLGKASALWRLGRDAGVQRLSATATGIEAMVTFTATALARAPTDTVQRPVEAGPVTVVSADFGVGGSHVCGLVSGQAVCRGANDRGQRGAGRIVGLTALATGVSHACGVNPSGQAVCWGANESGQLGDGSRVDKSSATVVLTELHFASVTAGAGHTCGLAGGGIPVCWGRNLNGQLGDGSRTDARFPRTVGGGLSFGTLVAGWSHTCGITGSGNAWCWGMNSEGQLGDGSRLDRLVPTLVRGAIETLVAGSAHTCGISGDQVLCWGDNGFGQLGDGSTQGRAQPAPVLGLPAGPTHVAAGAAHTCALVPDGSAHCWGQNVHGQLGDGSTESRSSASPVAGGLRFTSIYAGGALTCGFAADGVQYCWGLNQSGQLGDGTRVSRSAPTPVSE